MFRAIDPRSRNVAQGTPGRNRRSRRRLERAAQEVRARGLARVRGAAVVLGSAVGTKSMTPADSFVGQPGKAEKTLEQHFPTPAHEEALIHSSSMKANDPALKAAIANIRDRVAKIPVVDNVRAANDANGTGLVSKDGHSALVVFDIKGDKQTAGDRIAPVEAAIHAAQKQYPQLRIEQFGDASVGTQIDKSIQHDLKRAETLSLPVTLSSSSSPSARSSPPACLYSWRSPALSLRLDSRGSSARFSGGGTPPIVILLIGMAVGVDYSLFYIRREREERARGLSHRDALLKTAATSGQAVLISGATVMVAMAGMFFSGARYSPRSRSARYGGRGRADRLAAGASGGHVKLGDRENRAASRSSGGASRSPASRGSGRSCSTGSFGGPPSRRRSVRRRSSPSHTRHCHSHTAAGVTDLPPTSGSSRPTTGSRPHSRARSLRRRCHPRRRYEVARSAACHPQAGTRRSRAAR